MPYCLSCGHAAEIKIPEGDDRERQVCPNCNAIHYVNPRIVVGILPIYQDKILLCRRAIEPAYGKWTLPAGFMECNETISEGAIREAREEAGIHATSATLFCIYSYAPKNQVHMLFLSNLDSPDMAIGPETLEAKFFALSQIPWDDIAFSSIIFCLKSYQDNHQNWNGVPFIYS